MKKILIITPNSSHIFGFRKNLIEALRSSGYKVSVLTLDNIEQERIDKEDIEFNYIKDKNRSTNPFKILTLKNKYVKIIKKVEPDIVFTFQLKPNVFGVRAAKKAGVKRIFSMVEGTGDPFTYNTLKWKIIRAVCCFLYKKSFRYSKKVFFLNNDDKKEFLDRKLVKENQCEIIHGIGVDLEKFAYKPVKNNKTFLMMARMLQTKGIYEYCECARLVKQKYPDAVFNYLGAEGSVKLSDIQSYIDDGSVNYLGVINDVRPYIEDTFMLILPSYKEGMPMSVMEAESVGRGIIAFDSTGCRDAVTNGETGFLVPVGDAATLADKAIWCIEHPDEAEQMGKNARKFAEENFNEKKINKRIIGVIGNEK
ncbi:MAG: glycosyltransferase family 4 protein [Candidatus Borkfalkiaceae bacterium]|nr:glycosyltransferase family 4 protein [Christensenellaceae bacterium]